ncbi:hypothetical protein GDO86_011216 [Hymenochirus boettgeri]|uniref:Lysophospholipid acyltransferase 1 n=1 Tax=Hymenochirus boettgeri TaxID=247094 RepID=A0A8T2JDD4_9PIPI|nr:hypothetical protein GDO86_011216 [Hymenochirus boettgeri]
MVMASSGNVLPQPTGSALLQPVSQRLQIPLEQVNFVACQLFALVAAFWFRIYLSPSNAHPTVRHALATIIGTCFSVFCFGWYSMHLFILVLLCYCIMIVTSAKNVHRYSLIMAMGYLTICQINRVYIFNYGILTNDFSGPLMIITQKITTLAFQLHDGMGRSFEDLTNDQRQFLIKKKPSFLEYLSYHLNFMSVLAGPCSNFVDYTAFIEGHHIQSKLLNLKTNGYTKLQNPSPNEAVMYKLCIVAASLVLYLAFSKSFPILYVLDETFIAETSFLTRLCYLYCVIQARKPRYYFAWILADAVNNAAGYGFNGVDEKGKYRWDLISTLDIWNIEISTSFKMYIDNWNIQTAVWLKRICYDRAPKYHTGLTFLLSALWHGVYPGYYFTFITGIPVMLAARVIRKNFRHFFTSSAPLKFLYDLLTWIVTQLAVCYTVAPFVLLAIEPTIQFYKSVYFCFHILCFLAIILLPKKPRESNRIVLSKDTTPYPKKHLDEKLYQGEQEKLHTS